MYKRFVETGRVAFISDGPNKGKLCAIVDIIDQTRVLVDGPETGVARGMMRLNQLHLTKFRIKFSYNGPSRVVRKSWNLAKVGDKWAAGKWAKKLECVAKRRAMNDFDRFKLKQAKRSRNILRTKMYKLLVNKGRKAGTLYGMVPRKKVKKEVKEGEESVKRVWKKKVQKVVKKEVKKVNKRIRAKGAKKPGAPEKKAVPEKKAAPEKKVAPVKKAAASKRVLPIRK